ncbi:hypothetical protein D1646_15955 [Pseudoflavonifractor sp. 60]|uniref:hypothetical protein n=1 Tax=Pseudoflavonifractor sp. 60 TaxID=2304576 RepID=UPI00136CFBE5|nr:hypothetical protein [Pseudoflavonifractor sp. 60]NBI68266.1 hypothetical protein [Pseudoflavonifractor sp. 60]
MRLLSCEWSKLVRLPALWGCLALCLVFNCLLIGSGDRWRWEWNETAAMTSGWGPRVDSGFLDGLRQQPQSDYKDYLLSAAEGMTDIYADYDLRPLVDYYIGYVKNSPGATVLMERKYERLAERVAHLSQTGAAMDWYGGPVTHYVHQFLYGTLMRALLTEGAVLGMLSMLFLLGYENQQRTAAGAYASRTGRKLCRWKVMAGITWALAIYLLLAAVTLGIFLLFWDWSGVWGGSVSSQFNYVIDMLVRRPFFTWADLTVGSYLASVVGLGGLLTVVFTLLAAVCGTLMGNVYLAALVLTLLLCGGAAAQALCAQAGLWMGC